MNEQHYVKIKEGVATWNVWYQSVQKVADLRGADLRGAYLRGAYLRGAYLRDAYLSDAYLRDAYLRDADLSDADLSDADLRGAYLRGADLRGAYLRGAKLPAPSMLLLASWGDCSPTTTTALMQLDASANPKGEAAFAEWANGGVCPYRDCRFERVARFNERRELCVSGTPPTLYEAVCMVLDEHCPTWEDAP